MAPITPYISDGVTWHQANCALSDGVVWSGADVLINPASVSGATELIFHMTSNLTQKLYYTQSQANGVLIDWGDGSQPETYAELSVVAEHTYATAGDYIVTMSVTPGVTWSPGATIQSLNSNNETVTTVYGLLGNFGISQGVKGEIVSSFPTLIACSFGAGVMLSHPKALAGASSLTEIILPPGITSLPDYAFAGCTNLKYVVYPDTLVSVGAHAFDRCQYYDFSMLAHQLDIIGNYAFSHCSGEAGYLELKAASVGVGAFEYCSGLQRVWLRNSVADLKVIYQVTSPTDDTIKEYIGPFYQCDDGLILYAECYEADKPVGWMDHFNAQKKDDEQGTFMAFLVIWHQTTAPFVSLRMVWNAHGRELSFVDDNDLEIGYEYDSVDSRLITY